MTSRRLAAIVPHLLHARFPAFPGHWGGWQLRTYPRIYEIRFAEGGGASAKFQVGYQGGDLSLLKTDEGWRLKEVAFTWIQ